MVCAIACFSGSIANYAQNTPDPLAGPLWRPIEQLQTDPKWRLYAAVVMHDHKRLQALLDGGDSPNTANYHRLPLVEACHLGDLEAVKILVKSGADIDLYDAFYENPLFAATQWSHPEIVRYLLAQGAQVNARRKSEGGTALYAAVGRRNFELLTVLIQAGADVNLPLNSGDTPLMIASRNNDIEMIKFLKDKGAKFTSPNEELFFAASHGDVAALQRIITAEIKARSHTRSYRFSFKHQREKMRREWTSSMVNQFYDRNITPLMASAQNGQTAAVKALIVAGADINALDSIHDTPLKYAIKGGHKSTILALLDAGADATLEDVAFDTTLHQAAIYIDDPEIVHRLIASGVPVSSGDTISVTPLMNAAIFGNIQTVKILLDAHVPINVQSSEGLTALSHAAISGRTDILTLLLRAGADPSIKDREGKTALDEAIQMHNQAAINLLQQQLQPAAATPSTTSGK
jgi:ankyrin repeat protein